MYRIAPESTFSQEHQESFCRQQPLPSFLSDSTHPLSTPSAFPSFLDSLQPWQSLAFDFQSQVSALAICFSCAIVGLGNGRVLVISAKHRELETIHTGKVLCAALSDDGKLCVTGGEDTIIVIWNLEKHKKTAVLQGHEKAVTGVAIFHDNDLLISCSRDRMVKVWDTINFTALFTLTGHTAEVTCVSPALDSCCISGAMDHTLKLWSIDEQREVATLSGHSGPVLCLAVTSDGRVCVSAATDETVKVWDLPTRTLLTSTSTPMSAVYALAISYDDRFCVSAGNDGVLNLWSCGDWRLQQTLRRRSESLTTVAVSTDARFCVCGGVDGVVEIVALEDRRDVVEVRTETAAECIAAAGEVAVTAGEGGADVWNLAERRKVQKVTGIEGKVVSVSISSDKSLFATASEVGVISIWALSTYSVLSSFVAHSKSILYISFLPTSHNLISASADCTLRLWASDNSLLATLAGHGSWVSCVAVASNASFCVSASWDSSVKQFSLTTFSELWTFTGHEGTVRSVDVARGNEWFASGGDDKTVRVWSTREKREVAALRGHSNRVTAVKVTADGLFIVSGSWDSRVKVWSAAELKEVATLSGHTGYITTLAVTSEEIVSQGTDFSLRYWRLSASKPLYTVSALSREVRAIASDGTRCFTATRDGHIQVWSGADRKVTATLKVESAGITFAIVTPNQQQLIVATDNHTILLYDCETLQEPMTLKPRVKGIHCLAVSFDSRLILIAASDSELRLWSLDQQREVASLCGHLQELTCVAASSTSSLCATGSIDQTVKVWNFAKLGEVATFRGHMDTVRCVAITEDDQYCVSGSYDKSIRIWSIETKQVFACLSGHSRVVTAIDLVRNGLYLLSASADCSVKLWSLADARELVAFTSHTTAISSLKAIENGRYCAIGYYDGTVQLRDLAYVHQYPLSTPLESSSIEAHCFFVSNISKWKDGEDTSKYSQLETVLPHRVNCLHILAYYNYERRCEECLSNGVEVVRGAFGSPVTLSIVRKTTKCLDVFLRHFSALTASTGSDAKWQCFQAISEDLPDILASDSPALYQFLKALFTHPAVPQLPSFIHPRRKLPITQHSPTRMIDIRDFDASEDTLPATEIVDFYISLLRLNLSIGSTESVQLLQRLRKCVNRKVLRSPLIRTVLEEKWRTLLPFTWGLTAAYGAMMVVLTAILFESWETSILSGLFFALNFLFLVYELMQLAALGGRYFSEFWNIADLARGSMCVIWSFTNKHVSRVNSDLTLLVVVLSCLRAFTYFRSFRMTRVFVFLTVQVCKEVYHFLLLLAFSVFAFGLMASVAGKDSGVTVSWTTAFNLLMGDFDTSEYTLVQWLVFMCANVVNSVILLNLLIAILSDAYEKAQISMRENDYFEMLEVILELETLCFWRRRRGRRVVLVSCQPAKRQTDKEWAGKVKEITKSISRETHLIEEKVDRLLKAEGKVDIVENTVQGKINALEKKVDLLTSEVKEVKEQLKEIVAILKPH